MTIRDIAIDPLSLDFGSNKTFCVYLYRDPRRGKRKSPIYVGKGKLETRRASVHWKKDNPNNPLLNAVLTKIRANGLRPIVEYVAFFDDEDEAFRLERNLIKRYGRRDLKTGTLCNFTDGGQGATGAVRSSETRNKLSITAKARMCRLIESGEFRSPLVEWMKTMTPEERSALAVAREAAKYPEQRKPSAETKAKMRAASTGRLHTAEAKQKMRIKATGRKHSPETKAKLSAVQKGRPGHPMTAATKEALRLAKLGKKRPPEIGAAISARQKGRKLDPAVVEKIAAANRGKKRSAEARAKMSDIARLREANKRNGSGAPRSESDR